MEMPRINEINRNPINQNTSKIKTQLPNKCHPNPVVIKRFLMEETTSKKKKKREKALREEKGREIPGKLLRRGVCGKRERWGKSFPPFSLGFRNWGKSFPSPGISERNSISRGLIVIPRPQIPLHPNGQDGNVMKNEFQGPIRNPKREIFGSLNKPFVNKTRGNIVGPWGFYFFFFFF